MGNINVKYSFKDLRKDEMPKQRIKKFLINENIFI